MIAFDIVIVLLTLALAVFGFRQGLVGSLPMALGLGGGALLGSLVGAAILSDGHGSPYLPLIILVVGVITAALATVLLDGLSQTIRNKAVRGGPLTLVDRIGGAALMGAAGIALAWVIGLVLLNTPELSGLRGTAQEASVLQEINDSFPPSEEPFRIRYVVTETPKLAGPEPRAGAPRGSSTRGPGIAGAVPGSVRVTGTSCGLRTAGSGWVVRPRLVVTAAHVVAGQEDTMVETEDGRAFDTIPVRYDPRNDLAVFRVDGRLRPLRESAAERRGTPAAMLGYDEDGEQVSLPARLGRFDTLPSEDSYGEGPTLRRLLSFRGEVEPGLSGAPLVDEGGRVMGTVFARLVAAGPPAGLAIPNHVVRDALRQTDSRTDTGSCAG